MNHFNNYTILAIFIIFLVLPPVSGQIHELDIYNEWYCDDSRLNPERPFFVIRETLEFQAFWKDTNFGGFPPHIDFDKYMVFVWAPSPTRKDCNKVTFERLVFKDGCLLVLMDFEGYDKYMTGTLKKPVKAVIFPSVKSGDIFVFKKIKKGWEKYEWSPYYAIWDLNNERKRPFEYVYIDKENKPLYNVATTTGNVSVNIATTPIVNRKENESINVTPITSSVNEDKVYTPKQSSVSMPRQLPEAQTLSTPSLSSQPSIQAKAGIKQHTTSKVTETPIPTVSKATSDPINIGNTPAPKLDKDIKPEVAPGMGEDPLFGSEFDITF